MTELIVPRTCTEVSEDSGRAAYPLESFRERTAYVLLGAPGAGKTKAFEREAALQGGCYVSARDFATFSDRPEWHGTTLFIDGLDESRAGSLDQRTSLDHIRSKLYDLGSPSFRLSCREGDWFGTADQNSLNTVSPNGSVLVLRLDPLSDENVREILRSYPGIIDIDEFFASARQRGVDGLLRNPQSLKMLADAVTAGSWPESRKETFDSACRVLVSETNNEHLQANPHRVNEPQLLDAAGRLFAIQLLAGTAGYRLVTANPQTDEIPLIQVSAPSQDILLEVTSTRLFEVRNGHAAAVHRQVAEFLGGQYLASRICQGLPVQRVLALMVGKDGVVVSELRGLAAWLATHSKIARKELIGRDPIGTVLYGDVRNFSVSEKELLIDHMGRKAQSDPWSFRSFHELDTRWGDLATPDMETTFRNVLADPDRSNQKQAVAAALLEALKRGAAVRNLQTLLMEIVRNHRRPLGVRCLALDAYMNQYGDETSAGDALTALLDDVHSGAVTDPRDDLLGRLLRNLYPSHLRPSEVALYLRAPKAEGWFGWYQHFWTHDAAERSTNAELGELLDALVESNEKGPWYDPDHKTAPHLIHAALRRLLAGYLEDVFEVDPDRLLGWLKLTADAWRKDKETARIRRWLSEHSNSYKAIYKKCVERNPQSLLHPILFGATPPPDFGPWCVEQAIQASSAELANRFLNEVVAQVGDSGSSGGFSWRTINERLVDQPELRQVLQDRQQEREERANQVGELDQEYEAKQKEQRKAWHDRVASYRSDLRENRCPPFLLHHLAAAYLGEHIDAEGDTPRDRLRDLLEGDEGLVDTVIEAFRSTRVRNDLPDEPEVARLAAESRVHYLSHPFIAGLEEIDPAEIDETQTRLALAIRFTSLRPVGKGEWYQRALSDRPDIVANVLLQIVRQSWRRKTIDHPALFELIDDRHASVARLVVPQLLQSFPVRGKANQLATLKSLLRAALRHCPEKELLEIVNRKLAIRSMNVAQRIYWCCTGLVVEPSAFTSRLRNEISGGSERRVRHVASYLNSDEKGTWVGKLNVPALDLLVEFLGGSYRPSGLMTGVGAFIVTEKMEAAELVQDLIVRLSAIPSTAASEALEDLSTADSLHPWREILRNAKAKQGEAHREATFRHANVEQVLQTLDNARPANAADLAALTMDSLASLGKRIRHGETSDWRQYWNTKTGKPEHEDLCRDRLLSDLELQLSPLAIDAQPEGRYADDKRADIRVAFPTSDKNFNVPVEIKKSTHPDLWTAIHDQLIAKYARDPGAGGNGIYLVFWYGSEKCTRPPSGQRPNSAQELRTRLLETLTTEQKRKIAICVIDVSRQSRQ